MSPAAPGAVRPDVHALLDAHERYDKHSWEYYIMLSSTTIPILVSERKYEALWPQVGQEVTV